MSSDDAWLTPPEAPVPGPPPGPRPSPRPEIPPAEDTVVVKPPRRLLTRPVVTTFFVAGIVLLIAGLVTVIRLTDKVYERPSVLTASGLPSFKSPAQPLPSSLLRNRLGPTRLTMGKPIVVTGELDAKFQVTVKAGTFHRSPCNEFALKPERGGYLPVEVTVKVIEGEPDVSGFDFKFQQHDGTWLDSVGGSGCDKDFGALVRRLVAGRTYRTTLAFDVPDTRGDIVFTWPLSEVVASWRVG